MHSLKYKTHAKTDTKKDKVKKILIYAEILLFSFHTSMNHLLIHPTLVITELYILI